MRTVAVVSSKDLSGRACEHDPIVENKFKFFELTYVAHKHIKSLNQLLALLLVEVRYVSCLRDHLDVECAVRAASCRVKHFNLI